MGKEVCECGTWATLNMGRCWFCWQTGAVMFKGESAILTAFLHPDREDGKEARRYFPHLLRGARDEIAVEMDDGTTEYMTHFELASYPNVEKMCGDEERMCDERSRMIILSLLHLNPGWKMSEEEMIHRLSLSSLCKSCGYLNATDCLECEQRCEATMKSGKRCPRLKKGQGRKYCKTH